ncbi:MAG: hypothetical protein SCALA702_16430 [Melioribacteraceae bacterium]|nr:MAG: hypothetical protein SCALA702_16430 [Melioribacteraceae bacterium]
MGKLKEKLAEKKILVSDGAWGTELQKLGFTAGESPELWNLEKPELVENVATGYVKAGADIIETNSFGGSSVKLAHYGLKEKTFEINKAAAEISRRAAGSEVLVMGSVGPTGKFIMMGDVTADELYDGFLEQAQGLKAGGADFIIIETFYDITEAEIAIKASKEAGFDDIICSFTYDKAGDIFNTMMGINPPEIASFVESTGGTVLGTNCGNGFADMKSIVEQYKANTNLPVLVQANAGIPLLQNDELVYPETPEIVESLVPDLLSAGVSIIGGCCGTTPEHTKRIKGAVNKLRRFV